MPPPPDARHAGDGDGCIQQEACFVSGDGISDAVCGSARCYRLMELRDDELRGIASVIGTQERNSGTRLTRNSWSLG